MKHKDLQQVKSYIVRNNTYFVFLLLIVIASLMPSNFMSVMNLRNIALQQAAPVMVAMGMLFVILTGGIDLSVGSIQAFSAALASYLITNNGVNWVLAILIALAVSALMGMVTGMLVAFFNFQGFVASLAMMTIARGLAFIITRGMPIKLDMATLPSLANKQYWYPMLIITVLTILLFMFIQKYTSFGRIIKAIGSNKEAVSLAGIPTKKHLTSVYVISAVTAALAGIYVTARSRTGLATIGQGQELDAIAACVIGGASLSGGRGLALKTLVGALVLALIGNILNLMAVASYPQDIIKGIIIIIAVLLQLVTNKRSSSE